MHPNSRTVKCSNFLSVSGQDGTITFGKAHTRSVLSSKSLPNVALETVPMLVWLNMESARPVRVTVVGWLLFVGCLVSQLHAGVSQGRMCTGNCTCCHTETEVVDQTFYLIHYQYTHIRSTSPNASAPGARQDSHLIANF